MPTSRLYTEEIYATATITVEELIDVTGVTLSQKTLTDGVGATIDLNEYVVLTPSDANYRNFTWESSDESIVKVRADGVATLLQVGSAAVTLTAKNSKGEVVGESEISITVTPPIEVTSLTLTIDKTTLRVGETTTATVGYLPDNATNPQITLTSSNSSVVTVNADGTIVANNEGSATITATAHNTYSNDVEKSVNVEVVAMYSMRYVPRDGEDLNTIPTTITQVNNDYVRTSTGVYEHRPMAVYVIDTETNEHITDTNADHFDVVSNSNPNCASVTVENYNGHMGFVVRPVGFPSSTDITLRYTDSEGRSATTSFTFTTTAGIHIALIHYNPSEGETATKMPLMPDMYGDGETTAACTGYGGNQGFVVRPCYSDYSRFVPVENGNMSNISYSVRHTGTFTDKNACQISKGNDEYGPFLLLMQNGLTTDYRDEIDVTYDDGVKNRITVTVVIRGA